MVDGDGGRPRREHLRALFVNENLGGHRALHRHLRHALERIDRIEARFVDVPPARGGRRVLAAAVPGLGSIDIDLQPLRAQVAASVVAGRMARPELERADVVHLYSQNVALTWAGRLQGRAVVVGTDGTGEQNGYTLPYRRPTRFTPLTVALTRRFEERVYAAATLIVAQSEWAKRSLVDDYGIGAERIRVVRYGIPVPDDAPRVSTDLPEITFVGTSMERKGGHRLIRSFRRVLAGRAVLNIVTPEPVGAADGVRVHGDVRPGDGKLAEILARSAVFAFPSTIDKSSFAVMEAMAAGVAPLVIDAGGVGELVVDGESGRVIPDDDRALDAALVDMVDHLDRTRRWGSAARTRAQVLFEVSSTTRQLVGVLEEAAGLSASGAA